MFYRVDRGLRVIKQEEYENKEMEDAKTEVVQRYYMGSTATSPHSLGPAIHSEAFMFIKKFFHRKNKKAEVSSKD
jgi:hypothetical protein